MPNLLNRIWASCRGAPISAATCSSTPRRGLLAAAVLLAACAPRGEFSLDQSRAAGTTNYAVYVGTNRPLDGQNQVAIGRAEAIEYQRYDISVPPNRETGRIQWPKGDIDPASDFVTTDAVTFRDDRVFLDALRRELRKLPPGERDLLLFVPGYNTTLAEGVYRLAQLDHDLELDAVPVYFGWPTAESAFGYVHDRDSALYSRGDLEEFLRLVDRAGADQVILMAHSMGSLLSLEVMRQLELSQPGALPGLVDSVVLISPDVDEDLALTVLQDVGELPQPFVIFTNDEDRALRLATALGGKYPRLGRGADVERFGDLEVTFLDVTAFTDPSAPDFGHLTLGSSSALIDIVPQLREVAESLDYNPAADPGLIPGSVLSIQRATKVVLSPEE